MSEQLWRYWKGRVSPSLPKQHAQEEYARLAGLVPVADGVVLIEQPERLTGGIEQIIGAAIAEARSLGFDVAVEYGRARMLDMLRAWSICGEGDRRGPTASTLSLPPVGPHRVRDRVRHAASGGV